MTAVLPVAKNANPAAAREALMHKIADDPSLPALGSSISQVVQLASSGDEAVHNLAHFVLSDAGLTQKILRLANTVTYRSASGGQVTTISRAIFLLGFDAVKTSALAMLLVDGMSGRHAVDVRAELAQALCASIVGRELARRSHFKDSEEAAIAALFKNMGRLLVASHAHSLYKEVIALMERDGMSSSRAATEKFGCSFEALAESVLRDWKIPDSIIKALAPLPAGAAKVARNRHEWLQQVAAFSTVAAALIARNADPEEDAMCIDLLGRFGVALSLDQPAMVALFDTVSRQIQVFTATSDAAALEAFRQNDPVDETTLLPSDIVMRSEPEQARPVDAYYPSGKPLNAQELLLAGMKDVSEMMASGRCKLNDLMLLVLETLHRSMGFRFATICVRDPRSGQFRARLSLGERAAHGPDELAFALGSGKDLFGLALANNADLLISDAGAANIAALIPAWHRSLLPDARSFIVLPLLIQGKPFGLLYGDRTQTAPEGVPTEETALIKLLKAQIITALSPR